ncbi:MAG: FtsX-like permease family protein, partial [Actinomycetes bacterium]
DSPEPLPAYVGSGAAPARTSAGAVALVQAGGLSGDRTRFRAVGHGAYVPHVGRSAVLVDLGLALRLADTAPAGDRQVWLSRNDKAAEAHLVRALSQDGIHVDTRESEAALQRRYAGDGAVLALRLLLVCGGAAVVVSVGALLVAAYVGRRQRAYEVAALRVVGLSRGTVRAMLLRENLGTVLVALGSGAAAALLATWVVLPSLPQFDDPSDTVAVRYTPVAAAAWAAVGGLALVLIVVGLTVATLQLRAGRADRLREGVR